ncbi:hypothetical protein P7C70_g8882, partial [Phenoliferia sp. Uapishka_3]
MASPSPSPSLPTPQFPGGFPITPATSGSTSYSQNEGPLEAAGRSLPASSSSLPSSSTDDGGVFGTSSAGAALIGAAAGLIVGGLGGAVIGAGLGGAGGIERDALAAKAGPTVTAKSVVPTEEVREVDRMPVVELLPTPPVHIENATSFPLTPVATVEANSPASSNGTIGKTEERELTAEDKGKGKAVAVGAGLGGLAGLGAGAALASESEPKSNSSVLSPSSAFPTSASPSTDYSSSHQASQAQSQTSTQSPPQLQVQPQPPQAELLHTPTTEHQQLTSADLSNKDKTLIGAGTAGFAGVGAGVLAEDALDGPSASDGFSAREKGKNVEREGQDTGHDAGEVDGYVDDYDHSAERRDSLSPGSTLVGAGDPPPPQFNDPTSEANHANLLALPRPEPISRFSDSTFAPSLLSSASSTSIMHAFSRDGYSDQRAAAPLIVNELGDEPSRRSISPADLASPMNESGLEGFRRSREGEETDAMKDFAHLTPTVPSRDRFGDEDNILGGNELDKEEGMGRGVAVGAAAGVGAGALYANHESAERTVPQIDTNDLGGQSQDPALEPYSPIPPVDRPAPFNKNTLLTPSSPSGPSSTRAVKGSPTGTPAPSTPVSTSPRFSQDQVRDHEHHEVNEGEAGLGPVVLSPHMKIATRKDSIGHNRLHKTSLDSPTHGTGRPR